jgi:hypothetical protein
MTPQRDETTRLRYWAIVCLEIAKELVLVDESAANERTAERKYGWSPRGFLAG